MTGTDGVGKSGEASDGAAPVNKATRSVGQNIAVLMASQSVTWVLTAVVTWMVPRYLGPVGLGQIAIGTSIWMVAVAVSEFGSATMMTVEVARHRSTAASLRTKVIKLRTGVFIATLPVVAFVLWIGPYDRQTIEVAAIMGIGAYLTLIRGSYNGTLRGLQEMGVTARVDVLAKTATVIATVAVLLAGGRVYGIAFISVGVGFLAIALLVRATRRLLRLLPAEPSPLAGKSLVRSTLPFFGVSVVLVVYQQIDTVVMSVLIGEEPVGWYSAADFLFGSLLFVPLIIMQALFPSIAELHERDPAAVDPMVCRTFDSLLLISVPIGIGTIVVAPSFVDFLYGDAFEEAGPVLQIFGVVLMLTCQTILLGRLAQATGRAARWALVMSAAVVLSVGLDIVLVPWADDRYDNAAIAGALAYVATEVVLLVVGVVLLAPAIMRRATFDRMLRVAAAGAVMLAVSWPLRSQFFVVPGVVAIAIYVLCTAAFGTLSADERQLVRRGAGAARTRLGR